MDKMNFAQCFTLVTSHAFWLNLLTFSTFSDFVISKKVVQHKKSFFNMSFLRPMHFFFL